MPEILTESFCERCGTRYTFESAAPRGARLKGLKVMSRGLRNFVMSDDTSMDEAMAAARNETDREQTSQQLEAFHQTFKFCMRCRQYTCGNCWNDADGSCLSCAPQLGNEIVPAPFGAVGAGGAVSLTDSEAAGLHERNGHDIPAAQGGPEPLAWPSSDLMREADEASQAVASGATEGSIPSADADGWAPADEADANEFGARLRELSGSTAADEESVEPVSLAVPEEAIETAAAAAEPAEEPVELPAVAAKPEPVKWTTVPEERVLASAPEPTEPPAPEWVVPPEIAAQPEIAALPAEPQLDDLAAAAAANTSELLQRFRPDQGPQDEVEIIERTRADETTVETATEAEAEPAVPSAIEPRSATTVQPEPAPRTAPESEPVAAAALPEPQPESEPEPEPEPVAAAALPERQPESESEPEPAPAAAAVPEPEPAPAAAAVPEPEPAPAAAAEPEPEPAVPETRGDFVPQPTWQIVAPDSPPSEAVPTPALPQPEPSDTVAATAEPQWPAQPEWPGREPAAGLPFLGRPPAPTGGIEALWAESAREVAQVRPANAPKVSGGVQPCVSCGLSLSANARFCRRCGTRQG